LLARLALDSPTISRRRRRSRFRRGPRLLCPAIESEMLSAPRSRRHLETLQSDGWSVLAPEEGRMACGVEGRTLAEPQKIAAWIEKTLAKR